MKTIKSSAFIAYFSIILAPVILFAPLWLTGDVLYWGTPFLQFMPWRELGWSMIAKGQLPLWNPWVGMGAPLAANLQSAFYYPPTWLLFLLRSIGGIGLMAEGQTYLVMAHIIWAGIGMGLLARKLRLNALAQGIAGLSFSLCGYLVARAGFLSINAAVAWLPWVILAACRFSSPIKDDAHLVWKNGFTQEFIPDVLLLGLCLGMQLLTGHAQTSYFTILLLIAWVITWSFIGQKWSWKAILSNLIKLGLAFGLAAAISAVQLLPTAEYLLQSQRATSVEYNFATNYSFFPFRLITLIAPNLFGSPATGNYLLNADNYWEDAIYIGLLPLLLGLIALVRAVVALFQKKARLDNKLHPYHLLAIFLGCVAAAAMIMALGKYSPVFPFFYHYIPTFNMFQAPTRFSMLIEFSLCLLGGIGADQWKKPQGKSRAWVNRGIAGACAILLAAGAGYILLMGVKQTFIQAIAMVGVSGIICGVLTRLQPVDQAGNKNNLWTWLVMAFIGADLLIAGWGLNPGASQRIYLLPASTLTSLKPILDTHRLYLGSSDESQIEFGRFFYFNDFNHGDSWRGLRDVFLPDAGIFDRVASANNFDPVLTERYVSWIEQLEKADPKTEAELLALMDVSVIESVDKSGSAGIKFTPVVGAARARWIGCAQGVNDIQAALKKTLELAAGNQPEILSNQIVIETLTPIPVTPCAANTQAKVSIVRDDPDRVELSASSQSAGWIFLADSWYPGWTATVDSQTAPILRANYLFRAVYMPAGEHVITFSYHPVSFYLGAGITGFAWIIILGYILFRLINRTEV